MVISQRDRRDDESQLHIRRATMVHKLNQFAKHLPDKWVTYHPTTQKKMANGFKCQMPFVEYDCHGLLKILFLPICNSTLIFCKNQRRLDFCGGRNRPVLLVHLDAFFIPQMATTKTRLKPMSMCFGRFQEQDQQCDH